MNLGKQGHLVLKIYALPFLKKLKEQLELLIFDLKLIAFFG